MKPSPADMGVVELADAIAEGAITAEEAVTACLARAEAHGDLNAIVALEPELAIATARACDVERADGRLRGPLHGVPMAHKDMFYRAGKPSQCGSRIRADFVPDVTATVIERLDAAGAITIGRLHMAEFAMSPTGHNAHLGRCGNPWHDAAVSGGSSSGSGAAVAARIIPASLGSDTGGSVRLPAAFCGVVGLKPTHGLLPSDGTMPLSESFDTIGPLARSSRDIARLMQVLIAGRDDYEAGLLHPLKGVVVGVPTSYYNEELDHAVAIAFDAARHALHQGGALVVDVDIPDAADYADVTEAIWLPEAASLHRQWLRTRADEYGEQVRNRLLPGLTIPAVDHLRARRRRVVALEEMLSGPFARCDILITPVTRQVTPLAEAVNVQNGASLPRMVADLTAFTRPFSLLGLPALTTPMGFDPRGLPIGLQLVGRPRAEALLLRVGHAYEQTSGWINECPPQLKSMQLQ